MDSKGSAAAVIAEYLKHPDDLIKLPTVRKKIQREKALLEVKLKESAKVQLDATKEGIERLAKARLAISGIKEDFVVMGRLSKEEVDIEGWNMLQEVSRVHRNFVLASETTTNLRNLQTRIKAVKKLLSIDRADPLGPSKNLLQIHYQVSEMEKFRNETVMRAKKSTPEEKKTLDRYFEPVGELIEEFEAHYLLLAGSILEIVRKGNPTVVIKIVKIAEVEGALDEKSVTIKLLRRQNNDIAARFDYMEAAARNIKRYRAKVLDAIRASCKTAMERKFVSNRSDPVAFLEDLAWMFDDLELVREFLVDRFPADWNIEQQFVKAYHKALYEFLKKLTTADGGVDAASLLAMSQFAKEYKKSMIASYGSDEWIKPPLFDDKASELMEDYLNVIVKKMTEWTNNLMKTETKAFGDREQEPSKDGDNKYSLTGSVIFFEMLNQQVNLALDSNQALTLSKVVESSNKVMRDQQTLWVKTLDTEYKAYEKAPNTVAPGLPEYTMALANDQVKSANFAEAMSNRLEPLVSEKYKDRIADSINDAMDGYLDVAKRCIQVLIDILFNDIKSAVSDLFSSKWYNESPIEQIAATISDYMQDYKNELNSNLFDLALDDVIDTFLVKYIDAMRKCGKLKMPQAMDRIKEDVRKMVKMFATYKPPKELEEDFRVLDSILALLSSSKTLFALDYYQFAKEYGPQLKFVESILKARDDLDRGSTSDLIETIRRKAESTEAPANPTIFDRLPAATGLMDRIQGQLNASTPK
ncbi:exocyst complex component Sec6 [Atractiella rhizophila]|nr:exocyst complex component Sec6 [Atractiella rhizophila]